MIVPYICDLRSLSLRDESYRYYMDDTGKAWTFEIILDTCRLECCPMVDGVDLSEAGFIPVRFARKPNREPCLPGLGYPVY
jgi:hypothetical protein